MISYHHNIRRGFRECPQEFDNSGSALKCRSANDGGRWQAVDCRRLPPFLNVPAVLAINRQVKRAGNIGLIANYRSAGNGGSALATRAAGREGDSVCLPACGFPRLHPQQALDSSLNREVLHGRGEDGAVEVTPPLKIVGHAAGEYPSMRQLVKQNRQSLSRLACRRKQDFAIVGDAQAKTGFAFVHEPSSGNAETVAPGADTESHFIFPFKCPDPWDLVAT